jgi:hypothetical protein
MASTEIPPFTAIDDTRLHWAILAGCMVSKGLTGAIFQELQTEPSYPAHAG